MPHALLLLFVYLFVFERGDVAQTGLELIFTLPPTPWCWVTVYQHYGLGSLIFIQRQASDLGYKSSFQFLKEQCVSCLTAFLATRLGETSAFGDLLVNSLPGAPDSSRFSGHP